VFTITFTCTELAATIAGPIVRRIVRTPRPLPVEVRPEVVAHPAQRRQLHSELQRAADAPCRARDRRAPSDRTWDPATSPASRRPRSSRC
jgi:hypothetical protein